MTDNSEPNNTMAPIDNISVVSVASLESNQEFESFNNNPIFTCKIEKLSSTFIKPLVSQVIEEDGKKYCVDAVTGKRRMIKVSKDIYVSNDDLQRMLEAYHRSAEITLYKFYDKTGDLVKTFRVEAFRMSEELGEAFLKIARKISSMGCFVKYSFREDMISDAIAMMVKSAHKYKVGGEAKSANPFAYFTKMTYNTFILRIKKEKSLTEKLDKFKREKYPELMEDQGCDMAESVRSTPAGSGEDDDYE